MIVQALLPEFDHESAVTRTVLERIPEARVDWTPHPKSMSLGHLAAHIAAIPRWMVRALREPEFDLAPPGPKPAPPAWESLAATLATFDAETARGRAALAAATDLELQQPWTLKRGGETMVIMPRGGVLRRMVISHGIHHRAQLGVYLRMLDVPVPAMYGPTADTL